MRQTANEFVYERMLYALSHSDGFDETRNQDQVLSFAVWRNCLYHRHGLWRMTSRDLRLP